MTTQEWYTAFNCTHAHCPYECEHPQPFVKDDDLYCGRCFFKEGLHTKMLPCVPEVCN